MTDARASWSGRAAALRDSEFELREKMASHKERIPSRQRSSAFTGDADQEERTKAATAPKISRK